jgi:PAS domain S-box-containing protein
MIPGQTDPAAPEARLPEDPLSDTQRRLEDAESKARRSVRVLETVNDAYLTLDRDYKIIYANPAAGRMSGNGVESLLGQTQWDGWLTSPTGEIQERYRSAMDYRIPSRFTFHHFVPESRNQWLDITVYPADAEDGGGLHIVCADVTERVQQERRERFIAELSDQIRKLTNPDEVIAETVNALGSFLNVSRCVFADIDTEEKTSTIHPDYFTPNIESISGVWPFDRYGEHLASEYMAGRAVVVNDIYNSPSQIPAGCIAAFEQLKVVAFIGMPMVHSAKLVSVIAVHNTTPRAWTDDEVNLLRSVVERTWLTIEIIRRQRTSDEELDRTREIARKQAIFTALIEHSTDFIGFVDMNGDTVYVNRAGRNLIGLEQSPAGDAAMQAMRVKDFFHKDDSDFAMREFVPRIFHAGHAGAELRFRHVHTGDPIWVNFSGFTVVDPETGKTTALATITRDITEQHKRHELEQARAKRDSVIARIGVAIRLSLSPNEVQAIAVEALGKALNADRCYFVTHELGGEQVIFGRDYHAVGLRPMPRKYNISKLSSDLKRLYDGGNTVVLSDTYSQEAAPFPPESISSLAALRIRAAIAVPFYSKQGELVGTLGVAMTNAARHWTPDEILLTEQVATEIKDAMEAAGIQLRQRNIAHQLQSALLPTLPSKVAGMCLASYYRPALDEAEVGGDCFDVFSLNDQTTALCVFDVSGKGLRAAGMVATVRNMLRFALYNTNDIAEAAALLNNTLAKHALIDGFATMFLAAYDATNRTLSYVNCGQEPGLLWDAANNQVIQLPSTGPALGVILECDFEKIESQLSAGDVVALFTDGMTEVGRNRKKLLEIGGLSSIFSTIKKKNEHDIIRELITETEIFAGGASNLRDDIALLIGRIPDEV